MLKTRIFCSCSTYPVNIRSHTHTHYEDNRAAAQAEEDKRKNNDGYNVNITNINNVQGEDTDEVAPLGGKRDTLRRDDNGDVSSGKGISKRFT
jgi:hypothetical protein